MYNHQWTTSGFELDGRFELIKEGELASFRTCLQIWRCRHCGDILALPECLHPVRLGCPVDKPPPLPKALPRQDRSDCFDKDDFTPKPHKKGDKSHGRHHQR